MTASQVEGVRGSAEWLVSNAQKAHLVRVARATSGVKQIDTSGLTVATE